MQRSCPQWGSKQWFPLLFSVIVCLFPLSQQRCREGGGDGEEVEGENNIPPEIRQRKDGSHARTHASSFLWAQIGTHSHTCPNTEQKISIYTKRIIVKKEVSNTFFSPQYCPLELMHSFMHSNQLEKQLGHAKASNLSTISKKALAPIFWRQVVNVKHRNTWPLETKKSREPGLAWIVIFLECSQAKWIYQ